MKILILGSSGQLGSYATLYFRQKQHEVIEWDILNSFEQDLRVFNSNLIATMINSDFVLYFASDVGGAKYLEKYQDSYDFINNNMSIMRIVFDALKTTKVSFIFTSSQMADIPDSTYGNLKLIGEKLTKNLNGLCVRLWNVYGSEHDEEKSHVITDFINMAKYNNKIITRTDGNESRQFLYVEDFCDCIYTLIKNYNELNKNKNYHITSFEWNTIKDVARIISKISNCGVEYSDRKDLTQKNSMNVPDSYILKFWNPKITLEEGIKKLYYDM
jgi:nucleoside-diphosphate-sugar epimerase